MATIPLDEKFIGLSASVDTTQRRSELINAQSQAYTMQDIVDTVGENVNYLSVLGKAVNGTNVNGTTITKSSSILISANTLVSGDILNIDCSFIMNSFSPTQIMSVYVYSNTSDSLTGATLLGQILPSTLKGFIGMSRTFYVSPTQKLIGIDEFISNLNSNQSNSDYYSTITFNYTAAQYIIFACKVANTSYPTPQAHLNHAFITKV
jgi:hypothetical protein